VAGLYGKGLRFELDCCCSLRRKKKKQNIRLELFENEEIKILKKFAM
jgi:hypothetical protein